MAVERVLSNLNLISFKTEGGLQNHIDELQDGDLVFTPDNSLKGNLFDFKWTDHKLNDISWLNADTFSWQSGDVYVAAYEHLVKDAESGGLMYWWSTRPDAVSGFDHMTKSRQPVVGEKFYTGTADGWAETGVTIAQVIDENTVVDSQGVTLYCLSYTFLGTDSIEETIDGIQIKYLRAEDGHKICMEGEEANIQALYEKTGVAWYYVIDTKNKRFKLPRTKFGFTGLRDSVGNYVAEGLPNIMGTVGYLKALKTGNYYQAINYSSGAFKSSTSDTSGLSTKPAAAETGTQEATSAGGILNFSASDYSAVYGASNTVQPKATQMYLYFYVGNFERDAIEQTAGITSEQLNDKADVRLSNVGEVTNALKFLDGLLAKRTTDDSFLQFYGGTSYNKGAYIRADGESGPLAGGFRIAACDSTNGTKGLDGKPNGSLQWDGKDIVRQLGVSKGAKGYLKLHSGIIIQWGYQSVTAGQTASATITFPTAFSNTNYSCVATVQPSNASSLTIGVGVTGKTATTVSLASQGGWGGHNTSGYYWLAMGY